MYFNAMRRKGWDPQEEDMETIVAIHNAVNEQGWRKVLEWESAHTARTGVAPKLAKFSGKADDPSPRAYFLYYTGQSAEMPWDRHDWLVERGTGRETETVRYVIDFYTGQTKPAPGQPVSVHLDVRPALDSLGAAGARASRAAAELWGSSGDGEGRI